MPTLVCMPLAWGWLISGENHLEPLGLVKISSMHLSLQPSTQYSHGAAQPHVAFLEAHPQGLWWSWLSAGTEFLQEQLATWSFL